MKNYTIFSERELHMNLTRVFSKRVQNTRLKLKETINKPYRSFASCFSERNFAWALPKQKETVK